MSGLTAEQKLNARCVECGGAVDVGMAVFRGKPASLWIVRDGEVTFYCPRHAKRFGKKRKPRRKVERITDKRRGSGPEVVAYLDVAELQAQKVEWRAHEETLTPEEKQRIRANDFSPLRRPFAPKFTEGQWLEAGAHLRVQVGETTFRRSTYRVPIVSVEDFRSAGTPIKTYGEDPDSMANTLDLLGDNPNPPEPHGPGAQALQLYAVEAGARRALGDSERTQARLAEIRALPMSRRIVELQKLANERGVDIRDDARAFERRVRQRLERAA